ncbi:hypothetical protein IGB42_01393 [Andreprevotia sp. IGB-42]|nr:hypothetical protein IGB42_01393 [Andreprevotia sp. IGB-42]
MLQLPAGQNLAHWLAGTAQDNPAPLLDADGKQLWHYRRHSRFN